MSLTSTPSQPTASRIKLRMNSLTMPSVASTIMTMIRSAISVKTSPPRHLLTSLGRLSIQEGLTIIITWQMHAVGLRQMATSRSTDRTSKMIAWRTSTIHVPMSLGHGGRQSAHASGAGSPPSRAFFM